MTVVPFDLRQALFLLIITYAAGAAACPQEAGAFCYAHAARIRRSGAECGRLFHACFIRRGTVSYP